MRKIPVKGSPRPMLVDDDNYAEFVQIVWILNRQGYSVTRRQIYAHHAVLCMPFDRFGRLIPKPGLVVDHINGNKLDNRRVNLRWVSYSVNGFNRGKPRNNTSGYKGVSWYDNRWVASIGMGAGTGRGRTRKIGRFVNKIDAAKAYDAEARKIPGAYLNFPDAA